MRCVTYAGESVTTTDDVAEALVTLTASVASVGRADAVTIPIVDADTGKVGEASLVIGVGNDVLSVPTEWHREEPDFSAAASELRSHVHFPDAGGVAAQDDLFESDAHWDPDLESYIG